MTTTSSSVDTLCVNTIRTLAIDMVQAADSGHPGLPLGAAPMAYALWTGALQHDPADPHWPDRDRFVLSPGHGSALLYALLHLCGYDLPAAELKQFRQWGSKTPGHPEFGETPGVESTTGPLGQGTANAVGMALAERALAARFNRPGHAIVDHDTWALVSDGDLMEGLSHEAASLAGQLGLGKLCYLYDSNDVTLDGPAELCFSVEDVAARYRAYGWHVQTVERGDTDLGELGKAIDAARGQRDKPSLIVVRTTIGYGSPNKAGKSSAHGSPLGADEVARVKEAFGFDPAQSFHVPPEAAERFRRVAERGAQRSAAWRERFAAWAAAFPELAAEWERTHARTLPDDLASAAPRWQTGDALATREAGGKVLQALAARCPELIGIDADLSCSTKAFIADGGDFEGAGGSGRNVRAGVREHAMGAIANGILYHGGLRPFTSTFFVFSDYMRPAVRLAALARLPMICVWTHDSVAVGEDGPTHEPIEHLASLRAMPGLWVVRPADANETAVAWSLALERREGPTALVLSRQKLPVLAGTAEGAAEGVRRGGYVVREARGGVARVLLLATGSEVALACAAAERLEQEGQPARVVSLPCWEAFRGQDAGWRDAVLPPSVRARVSVEAGATFGWRELVGDAGACVGIDRFGASAPGDTNLERLGLTVEHVVRAAGEALARANA